MFCTSGVTVNDEFGSWMHVTRTARKKHVKVEPSDVSQNRQNGAGKASGGPQKAAQGSRFNVLNEECPSQQALGKKETNKNKEVTQEWRQKAESSGSTQLGILSAPAVPFQSQTLAHDDKARGN